MDFRSQGSVADSRPSSLALWRTVRKPMTWQKSFVSAYFVSLEISQGPDAVRSIGGRKSILTARVVAGWWWTAGLTWRELEIASSL
jgi:hypothetical protein